MALAPAENLQKARIKRVIIASTSAQHIAFWQSLSGHDMVLPCIHVSVILSGVFCVRRHSDMDVLAEEEAALAVLDNEGGDDMQVRAIMDGEDVDGAVGGKRKR